MDDISPQDHVQVAIRKYKALGSNDLQISRAIKKYFSLIFEFKIQTLNIHLIALLVLLLTDHLYRNRVIEVDYGILVLEII